MSITGIMNSALSALMTSQTALRTTASNIANVNTPDYVRREVLFEPATAGGQLLGVEISEIRRMVATFLGRESLSLTGSSARAEVESRLLDRVQAMFGDPQDPGSLGNLLSSVSGALNSAAIDPANAARRQAALGSIQMLTSGISDLAQGLQNLRSDVEAEVRAAISEANALIARIHELNPQIQRAVLAGETSTALMDQRDAAVRSLGEIINIRTIPQGDGRTFVVTTDGVSLVSEFPSRLTYQSPAAIDTGTVFPEIMIERLQPGTNAVVGQPMPLEPHLTDGRLRGLLDIRNNALPRLGQELGALAGAVREQLNALHNDATSVPAPGELAGRNTGLVAADALNFSGRTTLAVTDAAGVLVRRLDIDFTAGTISVDGGGGPSFANTVGDFVTQLDAALGGVGSASLAGGRLSIQAAAAGQGLVFQQDAAAPSDRGGHGFAHFFGLNDLVQARIQTSPATGVLAGDAHNFAPGGTIELTLRGSRGEIVRSATVAVAGATVGDMITELNTAFSGVASFALDADGRIVMTPSAQHQGARLETGLDTTDRAGTGITFTSFFALGLKAQLDQAMDLKVRSAVLGNVQAFAAARPDLSGAVPGARVLGAGDGSGARLMAGFGDVVRSFTATGHLPAISGSLKDYAAAVLGGVGLRSASADGVKEDTAALLSEVEQRRSAAESVNLDEELANMIKFQQSYNAGARLIQTVQELYDALLQTV